uniref:Flavin-containing monooxygenase n=1 Tax=Leersia perrieri TaxID=77586 RepID=A0A0D9WN11_9ORYZ
MDATKKRVAIVGAGASGLTACKHALAKGFRPVVFETSDSIGGVWRRTLASTRLQSPAFSYMFSDFPWPPDAAAEVFPRHDQVVDYLAAYACRHGVLDCVRFGCKVLAADYAAGAPDEQVAAWEHWSGNGEAFGDGSGEWLLTVQHRRSEATQIHRFDFLIICTGRFAGVAHIPIFPPNRGPEVFHGKVVHSMDYTNMGHAAAAELIRGKRVAVVGSGKSAFDTVAECAPANGKTAGRHAQYPCAMICRSGRWMVNGGFVWGVSLGHLFCNRLAELMVHKPGQGLALTLLVILLTPLVRATPRWLLWKLAETYYKMQIPMEKHGMMPEESFAESMSSCRIGVLPDKYYDMVNEGSIVIKKTKSFSFCTDGLVLDDTGERVDADVVVLATGFRGDRSLNEMLVSPTFRSMVADTPAPLYRQCVHPRIPQMAVIGYTENLTSIYTFEMMAKWVAHLLAGAFRLPSVRAMEASAAEWHEHVLKVDKPCVGGVSTWYNDELCRDMGYDPRRKKGILAEWLQPYGPADYADIL